MTNSKRPNHRILTSTAELIGNTPLFELTKASSGSRLLLKLEQFNPTGSCKVRMARSMILAAERSGALRPGAHIVEPTSGNTGAGIALVAIERGYKFTAIVDHHASRDKLRAMKAMGVNLIYVEGKGNQPSTIERRRIAAELAKNDGVFWLDQHHNINNNNGYDSLAQELVETIPQGIDYVVGAVGTGGTLCGTVNELRRLGQRAVSLGVEPVGSIIFGGPGGPYLQTGAGAPQGFPVGPNVNFSLIDEGIKIADVDAFATARFIARHTGLLVGGTAGAAIYLALQRLVAIEPESTMVALVCDAGEKYLDTIFNDEWLQAHHLLNEDAKHRIGDLFDACQLSSPCRRVAA